MAPVWRRASEVGGTASTSRTLTQPSDTEVGDLLIAHGIIDTASGVTMAVAGFSDLPRTTSNSGGTSQVLVRGSDGFTFNFGVFWRIADRAGTQNHAASWGGTSNYNAWCVHAIRAGTFDAASPIADAAIQAVTTASRSMVHPSIAPAMADCLSCLLGGIDNTGTGTPPAGYAERVDNTIGDYFADDDLAASGATGTKTVTLTASRSQGVAHLALAPVPVPRRMLLLGVG